MTIQRPTAMPRGSMPCSCNVRACAVRRRREISALVAHVKTWSPVAMQWEQEYSVPLVPNAVTDGCYINYADGDLTDPAWNRSGVPWHDLYWKQNYPTLRQAKARWDRRDIFRHAQSIRLPAWV